ncbi:MAG TPA: 2,5-didehydrogluconate reductase DkgB [Marinobacter sp.]|uniref:2,5-didehydrogluconate reductase DkgB n=2 Tax=root TaxID=1 RepID=A0A831R3A7_9GAMM|nr:2,5-didehydrogluconate reductase DkgB [Marinobacter antarcticus]HDZ39345.1 2,5-didehydrogluconate reductase DkgB [Marinobacter sp.]HEA52385.1 2,5-didehydrogluconate reductase DkgB [Marinobacter antarcticus]
MSFSKLPDIGMGTFRLKGNDARDAVKSALSVGYRHIDTAQMYDNEADVGEGISASGVPRDDIFLTTKIWHDQLHANDLIRSLRDSLARLKTDYVDLALIHWPSPNNDVPMEEYLGALRDAQKEGLAKHIGISNFTCAQMDQAIEILGENTIFTNQVEVHPFLTNRKVVEHAQKLGITVTGYMPLAVGKVMEDETLQRIGQGHNATPAQIAIAWVAARGLVPIPSSTRAAHQTANLDALKITLSDDEVRAIDHLDRCERIANPGFAPDWD